jgi:hypothetical protein
LLRKAVHNWVDKSSQRRSKVADDAPPGRLVEIATEATSAAGGRVDSSCQAYNDSQCTNCTRVFP